MTTQAGPATPRVLRILRFPLICILLLGGLLFPGMGVSNGFRATQADAPPRAPAVIPLCNRYDVN